MSPKALLLLPALLALFIAAAPAQEPVILGGPSASAALPAPPGAAAVRALLASGPRVLSYEVGRSEDGKWIRLSSVCEAAYPVPAATLKAILEDYAGAPKVFSRIGWVKILDRYPDGALTEQYSGVLAFGFKFYTTNRFHQWTSREGPYINLHFEQVTSGGTMRGCDGAWSLVDRSGSEGPLSFLHYAIAFETLAQFPGQEAVMRNFGESDILRVLKELGEAAGRG